MTLLRILPCALAAALLLTSAAHGPRAELGKVMFMGDSITHGINNGSWRWDFHKIMVDNGISYTEVGYNRDNFQRGKGNGVDLAGESYRNVPFLNVHSAHEGGCSWQYLNGGAAAYTQSLCDGSALALQTKCGPKYSGHSAAGLADTYKAETYFILLGINDILQNFETGGGLAVGANLTRALRSILGAEKRGKSLTFCGDGTMDGVADALTARATTKNVCILALVPPAANKYTAADHNALADFNAAYRRWAEHKGLRFIPIGEGMVDIARTPDDRYGALIGPQQRVDWIHPGPQTTLIMAGNVAKSLGYDGRTAGLRRLAATKENGFTPPSRDLQAIGPDFTLELTQPRLGNGAEGGWDTAHGVQLRFRGAELQLNEAGIVWAPTKMVLYSCDMSTNKEPLRLVHTAGDKALNIPGGFYVWLGDQLIGEALPAAADTASTAFPTGVGPLLQRDGAFAPPTTAKTED